MRDFFSDYEKTEEEPTETETEDNSEELESLRKMVSIEVQKAFDTFVNEWNETHKPPKDEPPKDEPSKDEPPKEE